MDLLGAALVQENGLKRMSPNVVGGLWRKSTYYHVYKNKEVLMCVEQEALEDA
jgi:hypothetical protein